MVPKKNYASGRQKWREVIRCRKLNELRVDDKYRLPNISHFLNQQNYIRHHLRLAGYYRRFMPHGENFKIFYSWNWMEYFDHSFLLTTDITTFVIGVVISQGPIRKNLPITYAPRTLFFAETQFSAIDRELLAIVWAVRIC